MSSDNKDSSKEDIDLKLKKIQDELPNDDAFEENSEFFHGIANPTRLKILYTLKYGELSVGNINSILNKYQSNISHHISILKKENILKWRKDGTTTYYRLTNPKLVDIIEKLLK
jgi:ArsR family transcriptional regulator